MTLAATLALFDLEAKGHQGDWPIQGETTYAGMPICIENKKGSIRSGVEKATGKKWSVKMPFDYGYIKGTKGKDGDDVDCFIGPNKKSKWVFIVHQVKTPKSTVYDEDKCMLGWDSADEAKKAYQSAYNNVDLFYSMTVMGIDEFKKKVFNTNGNKIHASDIDIDNPIKQRAILTPNVQDQQAGGVGSGRHKMSFSLHKNVGVDGGWLSNGHKINVKIDGKKIGEAGVKESKSLGKKQWTITTARVNSNLVGKGFGKHVYNAILNSAKQNGVSVVRSSDTKRSPGAEHAWNNLSSKGAVKDNGVWSINLRASVEAGGPGSGRHPYGRHVLNSEERIRNIMLKHSAELRTRNAAALNATIGDSRLKPGVLDSDNRYTPAAHAENQQIAKSFLNPKAVVPARQTPQATFILGKPGAGKSTILAQVKAEGKLPESVDINADDIMDKIQGYKPELAPSFHERASDIARHYLTPDAIASHSNVVFDTTDNRDRLMSSMKQLKDAGYKISVIHAAVDTATSLERAHGRFMGGGRYVPLDVVKSYGDKPKLAYESAKTSGLADEWSEYDNNGKSAIKTDSGKTSSSSIHAGARSFRSVGQGNRLWNQERFDSSRKETMNAGGPGSGRHATYEEARKHLGDSHKPFGPEGEINTTIKKDPEIQFNGNWHVFIGNHHHVIFRDPASTNWYEEGRSSPVDAPLSLTTKAEAVKALVMRHLRQGDISAGGPGSGRHSYGTHGNTLVTNKKGQQVLNRMQNAALKNAVLIKKEEQDAAEKMETVVAKHLGGKTFHDSEPVDVVFKDSKGKIHGVEVKTIMKKGPNNRTASGRAEQITMSHGAVPRKLAWAKQNKAQLHTVAIDMRNGGLTVYHANRVGSLSFGKADSAMQPVKGNFRGLKEAMGIK